MRKIIHCLRVGNHESANGNSLKVDKDLISQLVESFDWGKYRPAVTEGHPIGNNGVKACGWVKGLQTDESGENLYAIVDFNKYGKTLISDNQYKNVSIGIRTPFDNSSAFPGVYSIDHLALVLVPAIKGLREFSEKIKDNQKSEIIHIDMIKNPKIKEEEQDNSAPVEEVELAEKEEAVEEKTETAPSAETAKDASDILEEEEEFSEEDPIADEALSIVMKELAEKKALEDEVANLRAQMESMKKAQMSEQINVFAEKLYAEGRFSPAHIEKSTIVNFAERLVEGPKQSGRFDFCEGTSMLEQFMKMMQSVPQQVSYAQQMEPAQTPQLEEEPEIELMAPEMNGLKADPNSMALFAKAIKISKQQNIPFEQAIKVAMKS